MILEEISEVSLEYLETSSKIEIVSEYIFEEDCEAWVDGASLNSLKKYEKRGYILYNEGHDYIREKRTK